MVVPANGALNQARSSRIGITLTDLVEVASLSSQTFIVRPVGGAALPGKYSTQTGIVNFTPDAPLAANTTYEIVVPAGGIKDYAGNGVPAAFVSRFSTGGTIGNPVTCTINPTTPEVVGDSAAFNAQATGTGTLRYSWTFGDGTPPTSPSTSSSASHTYQAPAHYSVQLTVSNGTSSGNCSATQTVHRPLPAQPPTRSSTIALRRGPRAHLGGEPGRGHRHRHRRQLAGQALRAPGGRRAAHAGPGARRHHLGGQRGLGHASACWIPAPATWCAPSPCPAPRGPTASPSARTARPPTSRCRAPASSSSSRRPGRCWAR